MRIEDLITVNENPIDKADEIISNANIILTSEDDEFPRAYENCRFRGTTDRTLLPTGEIGFIRTIEFDRNKSIEILTDATQKVENGKVYYDLEALNLISRKKSTTLYKDLKNNLRKSEKDLYCLVYMFEDNEVIQTEILHENQYQLRLNFPNDIPGLIELLRTFAAVIDFEKQMEKYVPWYEKLNQDSDFVEALEIYRELKKDNLDLASFHTHPGYKKFAALETIRAVGAWKETARLIKALGLNGVIKTNSKEFRQYRAWSMLRIIPNS